MPNIDINAVEAAYNKADWAEVIKLLDNYFGNDTKPNYSTLKQTIENALAQDRQPSVANQQALKMIINELKKTGNEEKSDQAYKDQAYQEKKRNEGLTENHKDFYQYLLKFPYHAQHDTITSYFRGVLGLKANVILIHGLSKEILGDTKIPKFEIFTQHFLPNSMTRKEDKILPHVLGYTKSHLANNELQITFSLLKYLCDECNIDDDSDLEKLKEQLIKVTKSKLESSSLILPYVITKVDAKIGEMLRFIENCWNPLVKEIQREIAEDKSINQSSKYKNNTLLLLLLVEEGLSWDNFEVLGKGTEYNKFPSQLSMQISPINYTICVDWVNYNDGFFVHYTDTCICFSEKWNQNYIPNCGTIEGLLEKITGDIFGEEISFYKLLKSAKTN